MRARATGYISGYFFEEGEHVNKGQLLFRLDMRSYRIPTAAAAARIARADADVAKSWALTEQAQERAHRYMPLASTRAIPQEQYIDALAEVRVQEGTLDQAQADRPARSSHKHSLSRTTVRSRRRSPASSVLGKQASRIWSPPTRASRS